ncbi:MAG: AAA family ATPase [Pseudodesulfovibrio sp.]|nr:AAA family ATPase [Pseudodesulfovibrio sp.]
MRSDHERQFIMTMDANLKLKFREVIADGRFHRCGVKNNENGTDGSYIIHTDCSRPYGWGFDHKNSTSCKWQANSDIPLTHEETKCQEANRAKAMKAREAQKRRDLGNARRTFEDTTSKVEDHQYIQSKGVTPTGDLRGRGDVLMAPIFGVDMTKLHHPLELQSVQYISGNGTKKFAKGCQVAGGFVPIGMESLGDKAYISEGLATGLSVHEATGQAVFCALSASNLVSVARNIRQMYPTKELIIVGDDDHSTEGNPGRKYATEAATACNGVAVFPRFKDPKGKSDFNDLHAAEGIEEVKRQLEAKPFTPPASYGPGLVAHNCETLLAMYIKPPEWLMWPWLTDQALVMLYGPRGLGKTFVALTIALMIAKGGTMFGRWVADEPRRVLYLDGEMAAVQMQERLRALIAAMDSPLPDADNLKFITPDLQNGPMPDISTPQGQAMVDEHLEGVDLLIIDNLSTLCRSGEENSSESWKLLQVWLGHLKSKRTSVLIIHHAGKSGQQRGTSKKEDALETVIALRKPSDYNPEQGARLEVHFEKARGFAGDDSKAFCAQLATNEEGGTFWEVSNYHNKQLEAVTELMEAGLSVRAIADELEIPKTTAHRLMKQAKEA